MTTLSVPYQQAAKNNARHDYLECAWEARCNMRHVPDEFKKAYQKVYFEEWDSLEKADQGYDPNSMHGDERDADWAYFHPAD